MPNYEQFKQAWNSMGNAERRKYTEQYKNDSQFQQFAQQYSNEMKQVSNQGQNQNGVVNQTQGTNTQQGYNISSDFNKLNNGNGLLDQNLTAQGAGTWDQETVDKWNKAAIEHNQAVEEIKRKQDQGLLPKPSQDFDSSRLTNDQAQVTVKEGTAAQTGMPDYEANSEARDNEIVNNLNAYWNTNKSFFTDRETFNKNFEYDKRNDRQKALLDSFWKGKQDEAKASTYTNGESILKGVQSGDITPDIMGLLRQNNPEAYAQWQQAQEDEVKLRIANYTTPANPEDTAEMFMKLAEKLGITGGDPYKIYDNWVGRCEQLGVFSDTNRLNNLISEMESVKNERTAAISRTMQEGAGRKSQALINAEVAKTSALYDSRFADLQTEYNSIYNQRQQNLAIANQSAQALQMQGQEDSRVFNNKLAGLGFALKVDQYRTPEQTAQLGLQTAQIQNEMGLLNQSKSNDLALYNQYATNKLKNQMAAESTDLNTDDENLLRTNLNNILSQYYSAYGDIIKRSQPQVVDDVLKYAKENGISVAEALTKNFIEPLQSKQEYKNMIAKNYAAPVTAGVSINEDGTVDFSATTLGGIKYTPVSSVQLYSGMRDFIDDKKSGEYGGQCGKFVNDYLQSIGLNRIYDNKLSTKLNSINTDKNDLNNLSIGSIAVFDYQGIDSVSENARKYGHVAIVTEIDAANNRVKIKESNYDGKGTINTRWVKTDGKTLQGFFDPSKGAGASNLSKVDESKKQNYIEEAKRGMLTDTMIGKIGDLAAEQGWSSEWNEALKQGKSTNLTDAQIKLMDKTDSSFNSNAIVKEFESAINQIEQLQTALNDNSGVGDMSAIFTFMKTLDPSSVVRESEFNSAANTAGILNPSAIWQKLEKNANGKFLTAKQREDFKKIAIEFIKTKASNYNVKYNDLLKRYGEYGIDPNLAPTNMAELVISQLEGGNTTTKQTTNWYDKYTTVGGVGAGNVVTVGGTAYSSNFYDN